MFKFYKTEKTQKISLSPVGNVHNLSRVIARKHAVRVCGSACPLKI